MICSDQLLSIWEDFYVLLFYSNLRNFLDATLYFYLTKNKLK